MFQSIRFLIDENLPVDVSDACHAAGYDVVHVLTSDLRGSSDPGVWETAAHEQRILMTRDLDFPLPILPRPAGLVLMRVPRGYLRQEIGALVQQFLTEADLQSLIDNITVLQPGRPLRQRPFSDL